MAALGTVVRHHRESQGLTQEELAVKAKLASNKTVSSVELGKSKAAIHYQKAATGLGFHDAVEMLRAPFDRDLRRIMRLWPSLEKEQREDLAARAQAYVVGSSG